jgi:hypothetical protein
MRNFACPRCRNKVYFESVKCLKCEQILGFDAGTASIVALGDGAAGTGPVRRPSDRRSEALVYCANAAHGVCNWVTTRSDPDGRCMACRLNRTIQ